MAQDKTPRYLFPRNYEPMQRPPRREDDPRIAAARVECLVWIRQYMVGRRRKVDYADIVKHCKDRWTASARGCPALTNREIVACIERIRQEWHPEGNPREFVEAANEARIR